MGMAEQTVERRQLGLALARLRDEAGKSQLEAGRAINRSAGRISQVEHGKGTLAEDELIRLLDFYDVRGEERRTILALGTASRKRVKPRGYLDVLPQPFQRLAELQAAAEVINWYECGVLPGLLQSPNYIRALLGSADSIFWEASAEETGQRIDFRLGQQRKVLESTSAKAINLVFTEDSLQHVVGGPSVMRGQVLHLLQMMEEHPALDVRVVPNGVPDNPALGGGLVVLDFVDGTPVAFVSTLYGPYTYYHQPADTEPMRRIFKRVHELALNADDTRSLLVGML
ncbi:helix-turn-helix transcriptional regulator [Actinosynnema sp. NPDC047251]|uniref:Transcriptional regulator, XRE family n=1 Tax=Saccharothrix espanaensis (strain ATCC 51144 / DSM 44229 / JCM 9112 / NBRC 15066 / NRRL 15764) TaxID=1179773 RepID=K0KGI4_SACES|nr:helix-turn-helix transcriptional regulator [Saccharothrix espanaensis]CCH35623.1 Transcriptional regulator, XRE family [Saccharothrix espanaensis DSM 44229]